MEKLRVVTCGISGGRWLTGPFRDALRFPSTRLSPVLTCTRTPQKFGICPSFKEHFLSPCGTPSVTIRCVFHRCAGAVCLQPAAAAGSEGTAREDGDSGSESDDESAILSGKSKGKGKSKSKSKSKGKEGAGSDGGGGEGELDGLTVAELKGKAKAAGLAVAGTKAVLIARLQGDQASSTTAVRAAPPPCEGLLPSLPFPLWGSFSARSPRIGAAASCSALVPVKRLCLHVCSDRG